MEFGHLNLMFEAMKSFGVTFPVTLGNESLPLSPAAREFLYVRGNAFFPWASPTDFLDVIRDLRSDRFYFGKQHVVVSTPILVIGCDA